MIDSDDYIPSDYFEKLYNAACRHNADIAVCGIVKEKRRMEKVVAAYSTEEVAENTTDKLRLCKCPPDFFPVNKLYRRPMLEALGLRFAENVQYEDVMFVLRALCESKRLVTVPGTAYRYVLNPTSTVKSRQTAAKQAQKYAAHKAMVEYIDGKGLTLKTKHRNLTVRHFTLLGICLWKIKERGKRRTLRLFDAIPLYSWNT
jgi:GT2 family glycosyltransferase